MHKIKIQITKDLTVYPSNSENIRTTIPIKIGTLWERVVVDFSLNRADEVREGRKDRSCHPHFPHFRHTLATMVNHRNQKSKSSKEEELLLHDFSRNVSKKNSVIFYFNALIVSAIPICELYLRFVLLFCLFLSFSIAFSHSYI